MPLLNSVHIVFLYLLITDEIRCTYTREAINELAHQTSY